MHRSCDLDCALSNNCAKQAGPENSVDHSFAKFSCGGDTSSASAGLEGNDKSDSRPDPTRRAATACVQRAPATRSVRERGAVFSEGQIHALDVGGHESPC